MLPNAAARKLARVMFWLPLPLFAAIAGYQVFGPVPIGLANNGDFPRTLGPLRLWPAPPNRDNPNVLFHYFVDDYTIGDPRWDTGVPSSEWLIAALSKNMARWFLPAGTFQLRLMGLVHGSILMFALGIFLYAVRRRSGWLRLGSGFLLLFIWTDLEYVEQLSTAYTDTGAVVALAVLFAIAVHCLLTPEAANWKWALVYAGFGCFLLATKTQHIVALPFVAALSLAMGWRAKSRPACTAWLAGPLLMTAVSAYMLWKTPATYRIPPAFTVVFYKLAVLSPDPQGVLSHFHLPEDEFGKYRGHYAYEASVPLDDPVLQQRILRSVTPYSLASFYAGHPGVLGRVLMYDLRRSAPVVELSFDGYGHLRQQDAQSHRRAFELTGWSGFRRALFRAAPLHLVYLLGGVILISGLFCRTAGMRAACPMGPIGLVCSLLAIPSFLVASLLDGVETPRHLVFFQSVIDLTIFAVALGALLIIENGRQAGGLPHTVSWRWRANRRG